MDDARDGLAAEPAEAALQRLARRSRAPRIRLAWPWQSYAALAAFHVVTLATLWAGGFAPDRLAGVAACWVAQAAAAVWFGLRGTGEAELGTYPPDAMRLGLAYLGTSAVALLLTGGLVSPMFVTLFMPSITSLALFGTVRQSQALVGATTACLAALALAPGGRSWPELSTPAYGILTASSVLAMLALVGNNVMRLRRALRDSSADLSHVREEMASQALARARSLEEVGSQIAHELKNPLSAVKALAQLGSAAEGPAHERFSVIDAEVAGMQQVLRDYLSFTRPLEALRPERVELGAVVDDVLAVLAVRARRAGVHQVRRGQASVTADRRRLGEAILNLVANAIEATPPGGSVEVEVGVRDGVAQVLVRDTGSGMAPEVLARAGTPFFTTREAGTGLGIVLARSVLQQHGGAIRIESDPGRGTAVTATLPIEGAPPAAGETLPPAAPRLRLPWRSVAVMAAFNVTAVVATILGGLSPARVAGVAAISLLKVLVTFRYAARASTVEVGTFPSSVLVLGLVHVIGTGGWLALAGGLQSPFLVTIFPTPIITLALFDLVWQTGLVLAATVASVAAGGLLPAAVTGPPLAAPAASAIAGLAGISSMLVAGSTLARGHDVLGANARELARARDELASGALARARSLEEVGAKVARDLEHPLAVVGRQAREGAAATEGTVRQWFEVVEREVARMRSILTEYLSFARPLQSFRPERVQLGPLVADVLGVLSGRATRAGVQESCRGDVAIDGDPRRLKEALLNLVANAIDATPSGGQVDVQVAGEGEHARIVIRDTGPGMPASVLERVGTPFFTTREAGTGLGVVLARSVFLRHGGSLRYESELGRGTTVTATLPFLPHGRATDGDRAPRR